MRHWVNFGLLFSFLTLAVSGYWSFSQPFSIATTRLHVVFGITTFVLVGLHLATRLRYFRSQLSFKRRADDRPGRRIPKWGLALVIGLWCGLLMAAWTGQLGTNTLLQQSYEATHRAEIVRASSDGGFLDLGQQVIVSRQAPSQKSKSLPEDDSSAGIAAKMSLNVQFQHQSQPRPALAVWTESVNGSMIETLYLDAELAYSDQPKWYGKTVARNLVLPIWRNRYTLISGVEPSGEVDAFSGATAGHRFTLDDYLQLGQEKEFVLCVEVNQAGDTNAAFDDPVVGQPSVLYTALIELDSDRNYWILELTGHGGGAETSGAIQYDLERLTSAKELVELLLVKITRE